MKSEASFILASEADWRVVARSWLGTVDSGLVAFAATSVTLIEVSCSSSTSTSGAFRFLAVAARLAFSAILLFQYMLTYKSLIPSDRTCPGTGGTCAPTSPSSGSLRCISARTARPPCCRSASSVSCWSKCVLACGKSACTLSSAPPCAPPGPTSSPPTTPSPTASCMASWPETPQGCPCRTAPHPVRLPCHPDALPHHLICHVGLQSLQTG